MIPVNTPLLTGNEKRYLSECIESGWISSEGPFVREFEDRFAASVNRGHGIAVTNGSAALEAAVAALGISNGDEVIMPAFTIISCAIAVLRAGGHPVLVDADPLSWNMDVDQIEAKITPRTRAIMAVHIYGLTVDMTALQELADRYQLPIIEDAAEAIGQECDDQPCGSFGRISIFSFYPNKLVTTGEGGMIFTDDPELAERCRSLRNLCFKPNKRFYHEELGWNLRMTNLQAAVGLAQLENLQANVEKKRWIGAEYDRLLAGLDKVQLPLAATEHARNIYWVYGIVLDDSAQRDAEWVMGRMSEHQIGTRPFFWPMHEQPVFLKMGLFSGESYPVAERIARMGFYLPSGLALCSDELEEVAKTLRNVLA